MFIFLHLPCALLRLYLCYVYLTGHGADERHRAKADSALKAQNLDQAICDGAVLRYQSSTHGPEILVPAGQVVEIWYDYNPFGWMHANNWRIVYISDTDRKSLTLYDPDHLKVPFLSWLANHIPGFEEPAFLKRYGSPGDDKESELVWSRDNRHTQDAAPN